MIMGRQARGARSGTRHAIAHHRHAGHVMMVGSRRGGGHRHARHIHRVHRLRQSSAGGDSTDRRTQKSSSHHQLLSRERSWARRNESAAFSRTSAAEADRNRDDGLRESRQDARRAGIRVKPCAARSGQDRAALPHSRDRHAPRHCPCRRNDRAAWRGDGEESRRPQAPPVAARQTP